MTTLDDLEVAVRAHAVESEAVPESHLIVAWTLVGEAVDPDRVDGVRIFHLRSDLDPLLELGMLTARQREMEDWVTDPRDDEL